MINTAPDAPFGGFPDDPADPGTTGQVMRFVVNSALNGKGQSDPVRANGKPNRRAATSPYDLVLNAEPALAGPIATTRQVSLNEGESEVVCVQANEVTEEFVVPIEQVPCASDPDEGNIVVPFGPKEALLGTVTGSGDTATGNPLKWTDASDPNNFAASVDLLNGATITVNVTENPTLGDTEDWEIYNFTADAHPIHLHLVRFEVIGRTLMDGSPSPNGNPQPWERGYKDTVLSFPGEITTIRAKFDVEGLYVWHCHIVEHEDNEMMVPYCVGDSNRR